MLALLNAQQSLRRFDKLSVAEGLSNHVIYSLFQDSKGFLWFGGEGGLNRYDGYGVKIYKHDPANPYSLRNNMVLDILESHHADTSFLWLKTSHGLERLNLLTDQFTLLRHDPDDSTSISSNNIRGLFLGKSGCVWVATNKGLNKFDHDTGAFTHFLQDISIRDLYEDERGILWISTPREGLLRFSPEDSGLTRYRNDPQDKHSISSDYLSMGIINSDYYGSDFLWVSTRNAGFDLLNKQNGQFTRFTAIPENATGLAQVQLEIVDAGIPELWVRSFPSGVHILNLNSNTYTQECYNPDRPDGITIDLVHRIIEDRSGVIWLGTYFGVNRYNRQERQFTNYEHILNDPQSMTSSGVIDLCLGSQNKLWIGTDHGLNVMDLTTGKISNFVDDPLFPTEVQSLLVGMFEDHLGMLWITTNAGLYQLNAERTNLVHFMANPSEPGSISHNSINEVIEDEQGSIWVSTSSGLNKYQRKTRQFEHFFEGFEVDALLIPNQVDTSVILVGTRHGLVEMNTRSGQYTPYTHDPENPQSLSENRIQVIYESRDGIIWIGTNDGLNRTDLNERVDSALVFTHYTEAHGLSSSAVLGILEDDHGYLWLSTMKGLSKFDPKTGTFRNYDKNDGFCTSLFIYRSCVKDSQGFMYFGGLGGFTRFHPDSLQNNPHVPPIAITDFQVFHQSLMIDPVKSENDRSASYLPRSIPYLDAIELSYQQNVFSFEFAALDFRNPMRNQYAYMLEGFNDDWTYTDASNRTATYTNLDPGEYIFQVKGSNNDGLWNEEGTSIRITISPPWWKTKLAYSAYFLLIIAALIISYRLRITRLRLQYQAQMDHLEAERYHEIDELKSRFFANISHEFRTPLTLILGPISKLLSRTSDSDSEKDLNLMQRQAKRLLELVTQLLDLSKLEAGKMKIQASQQNIIPLLKGLTLSFASLAERDKITLSFNTELEDIQVFVEKDAIAKIINNLLSNAFKFTETGGTIQVNVTTTGESYLSSEGEICIAIQDNGVGIPAERVNKIFERFYQVDNSETREREGTGIGLALTRELIELHKGRISVSSKEGEGTTFTIRLPLGSAHLSENEIVQMSENMEPTSSEILIPEEDKVSIIKPLNTDEAQPLLLIVEDNSDVRSYIRSYLDQDYTCHEAKDGEAGLKQALELIPDLIISDVMMPKMDGVEFCKQIKSDVHTSHIPVILLTAKADLESKLEGLETGADAYLTKPFEAEELLVRIKNLIEQRELLRQRFRQDLSLVPAGLKLSSMDQQFLEKATGIIRDHINDFDFNADQFSKKIFMSRQHLNRKLKALTGHATLEFVRSIRLKSATQLLRNRQATITEIAYEVGFSDPSHFTKSFQKEFGQTPSAFLAEQKTGN